MSNQTSLEVKLAYLEEDLLQAQATLRQYQLEMLKLTQRMDRLEKKQSEDQDRALDSKNPEEDHSWG